jgi:hypothetical protein
LTSHPLSRRIAAVVLTATLAAPLARAVSVAAEGSPRAPTPVTTVPKVAPVAPAAPVSSTTAASITTSSTAPSRERLLAAAEGLDPAVLDKALAAHAAALARGDLKGAAHPERLTVIDYSRSSTSKRLWVLDLDAGKVLFHEHVAHGEGSGGDVPTTFGNDDGSHRSSLGLFKTAEVYVGKHGRSLRLDGLEPGVNDAARARAVVVHGADYVSQGFIASHGRLGRSWGCPAVRTGVSDALIDTIRGGSLVFAYYPDQRWLGTSKYLNAR